MDVEDNNRPRPWKVLKKGGTPQRLEETFKSRNRPDTLKKAVPLTCELRVFEGLIL
jgi:hypothetical protein